MKTHWFRGTEWANSTRNFGDWLTPYFLHKLTNVQIEWARPQEAEMFGCGSIVELIPKDFKGIIFTAGMMNENHERRDLAGAQILGLRGPLTAERIMVTGSPILFGDLGLLLALFNPNEKKQYEMGVIPHYVHQDREYPGYHKIDVRGGIEHVLREASKCERILSTSLHGVILSDAIGVESQWEPSDKVLGSGFKFRDYAAALNETIEPGVWRLGNQERIGEIAERLKETIGSI